MSYLMTGEQLAKKCKDIAQNYHTIYILGCFGDYITASNADRYINNSSYNKGRASMIRNVVGKDYFGFDCVCLIKGVLWGWNGSKTVEYGGAKYASNGVPDIDDSEMFAQCTNKSSNFSSIKVGEAVHMDGHIGIYLGDGLAVECTPKWKNKVQITSCNCDKPTYYRRDWSQHGELPWISYSAPAPSVKYVTISMPTVRLKSKGNEVKTLQRLLNQILCLKLAVDGSFGSATNSAVLQYQKKYGLEPDGSVGVLTWTSILTKV